MKKAVKNQGKLVDAYELGGANSEMEIELIKEGKILRNGNNYELFSQESVNGSGEKAKAGDFFKVDNAGFPYPNARKWFLANHRPVEDGKWEQIPSPMECFQYGDEDSEVIDWMIANGKLTINTDDSNRYWNAELWGTFESAPIDSTVIFYGITRDENGEITDVDFNFVAKDEFESTYSLL